MVSDASQAPIENLSLTDRPLRSFAEVSGDARLVGGMVDIPRFRGRQFSVYGVFVCAMIPVIVLVARYRLDVALDLVGNAGHLGLSM